MAITSFLRSRRLQQLIGWITIRPQLTLMLLTVAALAPFLAKPFNIDDPLFIWVAKHIQTHPAHPYDFNVYWYKTAMPMWEVTKNPPLAGYYLALAASILGWSEIALHGAFLIPAVLVILGTYRLARHFCQRPIFAASTTLFMPVFLVSSTSVMCDVLMLAFWVWAMALWVEGMKREHLGWLIASAILMTLAALTKYFGVCLIPLLAAYSLIKTRRVGGWAFSFLIPMAGLIAYQWITFHLYGQGLLTGAGEYANQKNSFHILQVPAQTLTTLAFTGGCAAVAALLAPWLWRGKIIGLAIVGVIALFAVAVFVGSFWDKYDYFKTMSHARVGFQVVFWAMGGVTVLGLATADAWQRRDAESYLLALWVGGTFLFTAFFNWTVNGRSILPMAPAVAILLARRLSQLGAENEVKFQTAVVLRSVLAAMLGLLVTRADYKLAQSARLGAQEVSAKYGHGPGKLWFLGHWGWQYYMEQLGAQSLIAGQSHPTDGDFLAIPFNNNNTDAPTPKVDRREILPLYERPWLSTMNRNMGAGFYHAEFGPVPFAFGNFPLEAIHIFVVDSKSPTATANP